MTREQTTNQEISMEELNAFMGLDNTHIYSNFEGEVVRDPITGRVIRGGDGSDANLSVSFTREAVYSKLESYKADKTGRTPKYVDMDFITIAIPGDMSTLVHRPVTEADKWRFPKEYEVFIAGQAERVIGTPLHLWPELSPSQIKELEYHGVRSIEQLANLSDSVKGIIAGFSALRDKAKAYLTKNEEAQRDSILAAELSKRDEELAEMRAQLEALMAANKKTKA